MMSVLCQEQSFIKLFDHALRTESVTAYRIGEDQSPARSDQTKQQPVSAMGRLC
jgi:hypothetical protein